MFHLHRTDFHLDRTGVLTGHSTGVTIRTLPAEVGAAAAPVNGPTLNRKQAKRTAFAYQQLLVQQQAAEKLQVPRHGTLLFSAPDLLE